MISQQREPLLRKFSELSIQRMQLATFFFHVSHHKIHYEEQLQCILGKKKETMSPAASRHTINAEEKRQKQRTSIAVPLQGMSNDGCNANSDNDGCGDSSQLVKV